MQIFCRALYNSKIITTLEVKASDTIKNVKAQITNKVGIPFHMFYLLFTGKQLDERRTVADYNIQENDTIGLKLRLLGNKS
jgi:ubiquitin C